MNDINRHRFMSTLATPHIRIVHKCPALGVGRHIACCDIFETFDNGLIRIVRLVVSTVDTPTRSLSRSIVSNDHGQWVIELDHIELVSIERPGERTSEPCTVSNKALCSQPDASNACLRGMYGISDISVDSMEEGKTIPSLSSELMARELLRDQLCHRRVFISKIALIAEKQTA